MRSSLLLASVMSLAIAVPSGLEAQTLDINLRVGTSPPPPRIVYREMPRTEVIPNTSVHIVIGERHDYDYFRYGVYWYIYRGDHWYRARRYNGPFTVCEAKYVPRAIISVPQRFWRHHPHGGPPGQLKKAAHQSDHGRHPAPAAKKKGKRGKR
jgi:hypothetical protein